ncbi:guanylate cyclase 32E-like [Liolophura sinensis]|uniref:guanylate cyclase 32E-like n=1 Tax=Liolophura sinensis TaxID=3198878 RepID=UPI00315962FA
MRLLCVLYAISRTLGFGAGEAITLGLLIPFGNNGDIGRRIGGAMNLAVEKINQMSSLSAVRDMGYNFNFIFRDSACSAGKGMLSLVELYHNYNVQAFIGAYCDSVCGPGGLLSAELNLPMISYGCTSTEMSDKTTYPMFARTVAPITKASIFVVDILKHFNWTRICILSGEQHLWHLATSSFKKDLEASGIRVKNTYQVGMSEMGSSSTVESALQATREQTRVFLLCLYGNMVDIVMKTAQTLGMLNGDFVFLSLEAELSNHVTTNTNTEGHGGHGDHASHRRKREADLEKLYQSRQKREMTSSNMNMSDGMVPMNMSHGTSSMDMSHDMTTGHTSGRMMVPKDSHLTG